MLKKTRAAAMMHPLSLRRSKFSHPRRSKLLKIQTNQRVMWRSPRIVMKTKTTNWLMT
jgi:hypothetical protein